MIREALSFEQLRRMPTDEAAAWLVVRREEGLTASEQQLLEDWLRADPAHALALEAVGRTWSGFDGVENDELIAAMRAHALAPATGNGTWPRWPVLAAAAAVLLAIATSLFFVGAFPDRPGAGADKIAWMRYASAHGEVRKITLADGSLMTLDTDSVAEARLVPGKRAVRLRQGRALFAVKRDPTSPFAVSAANRHVVALGTQFEVGLEDDALVVKLFEGRVAIEPITGAAEAVTLRPGQQFIERGGRTSVSEIDLTRESDPAWQRGLIDLDDTPLVEAVAEVNRYSRDQIRIDDPELAHLRVSGQFRAGDAERFARTLAEFHPVRVQRRGEMIELSSRK